MGFGFVSDQGCPSYLFVLLEIIDNSPSLNYSPPHYGNYTFYNFCLYIFAVSGQKSSA